MKQARKDPSLDKLRTFLKRVESGTDLLMFCATLAIPTALVLFILFLLLRMIYGVLVVLLQSA